MLTDIKKPSRQDGRILRAETLMLVIAVLNPLTKHLDMYWATRIYKLRESNLNIGLQSFRGVYSRYQNRTISLSVKKNVLGRVQMETIGGSRLLLNFKDEPNLKKCNVSSGRVAQYIRDRDSSRHRAHSTELLANFLGVSSKLHS